MKKFFTILLIVLYSLSVQATTFHLHYCMDKWVGVGLTKVANDKRCINCGMLLEKSRKNNCCKDVQQQIKVSHDQSAAHAFVFQVTQPTFVLLVQPGVENLVHYLSSLFIQIPAIHAPPNLCSVRLFISNCIFLI